MRIKVISIKGVAPEHPNSHEFDRSGGTIGREPGNQLILPDPDKHISRMQAQVFFESNEFVLIDHGGNPTSVNGRPLGKGNRVTLHDGDQLEIAGYVLRAELAVAPPSFVAGAPATAPASDPLGLFGGGSAAADPFSDLGIAPAPAPASPFGKNSPFASAPAPAPIPAQSSTARDDDPFAVFAPVAAAAPAAAAQAKPPSDFDPFAPSPPPAPAARSAPLGLDLPEVELSVDALFDLGGPGISPDPLSGKLFDGSTSQLMGLRGPAAASEDPLALLSGASAPPPAVPAPVRDDAALLNAAFTPPRPLSADLQNVPASVPAAAPAEGMVFSWSDSQPPKTAEAKSAFSAAPGELTQVFGHAAEERVLNRAEAQQESRTIVQPHPATQTLKTAEESPRHEAVPEPHSPSLPPPVPALLPSADAASIAELLAGFQRGLGFGITPPGGLTPAFMEQIGRVLNEATAGTMALLTARALTKREVQAEVTMIVSKGNNPLKFSPDVQFALIQLLAPQGLGFMPPVAAMRDAYDDLRSHQFGFMAGMRAALSGILDRFKPEQLETRLADRGFLDSVLPGARKAKLWDQYEKLYGDISREAEDDFHSLFGQAFLKAYEEQVERLNTERDTPET
ncbi:type VI secretion system-associated FHA domain protein TagH [Niveibacterium sp. SC-1]|uniref:type VI secretion system-associated FHA domain protein TagH n=1 Tax=Niveibacterium sp. SC-1 TaxID=3135646 RepID=UPI00311D4714